MLKALKERRWTWRAEALSALSRITYRYGCNYLTSVALDPWISALSSGSPPLSLLRAVIQELRSLNSPMAVSRVELASEAAMAQQMYSRGDGRAATAQDGANTPPQYIGQIWYQSQVRKWMSGLSGVLIANLCTHIFYCYVDPCKMDGAINTRSCKAKYIFSVLLNIHLDIFNNLTF